MASPERSPRKNASAGHKLGQLVGDWFEEYFVLPLLQNAAKQLDLYLDHRFQERSARGEKILWKDEDGNAVDYDFVLEIDGTEKQLGIPVAFFECFWRRGSRHSKDKAQDDSGKLLPMTAVHPTARFLGIVAAGDFTKPARQLILSRNIDLFYVPKEKVISAFGLLDLEVDYPDTLAETEKQKLVRNYEKKITNKLKRDVASELRHLLGKPSIQAYLDKVRGALGALPQEIRISARHDSHSRVFASIPEATAFLNKPAFDFSKPKESYLYQITYSDATEFERVVVTLEELKILHTQTERLATHMSKLSK